MSVATGTGGRAAVPAGNGGGTAPLAPRPRLPAVRRGRITMSLLITMSSRVVRFAGAAARPGTAWRG